MFASTSIVEVRDRLLRDLKIELTPTVGLISVFRTCAGTSLVGGTSISTSKEVSLSNNERSWDSYTVFHHIHEFSGIVHATMLSAFTARPIVELKQRDKSKIESILAYGIHQMF